MAGVLRSLSPLARASATGITFKQLNLETAAAIRPEVIAVIGQYATGKTGITEDTPLLSDGTTDQAFALFGASPLYYAATKLFPLSGNGAKVPVYFVPVEDGTTAATGNILFSGAATKTFTARVTFRELPFASAADAVGKIATNAQIDPAVAPRGKKLDYFNTFGIRLVVTKGDTVAEITTAILAEMAENPDFPLTGAENVGDESLDLTAKWKGATGNFGINMVLDNGDAITSGDTGLTLTVTDMSGGADAVSVSDALASLTESFGVTRVINQFDDDTNLDAIQAWGEGLRTSLVSQFVISYFGREYDESGVVAGTVDVAAIKTFGDGRRMDAVNSGIYGTFGDLREMLWDQRDTLVKAGITNIEIIGGVPTLMDVVTFFHPEGVLNPIFRYDDSITKEGNLAFDLRYFFSQEDWMSKIIVSVDSKTTNPNAIDINGFAAAVNGRAELWEKAALIASAIFVKENSIYEIDDLNPTRFNANIKGQLTSTGRIFDNTLLMGFLFGESA